MGDNINLDRIRDIAKRMNSNLEKQVEESRYKEKKLEYQYTVDKMDEDSIERELDNNKGIYSQINYSLDNKKKELNELKRNPEIRRYIQLLSQVEDFEREKKLMAEKIGILEQKVCNHEILYLMTYPKISANYFPTFRCLCCGKSINGFIDEDQIVVNKDFLDEDEYSFKGNIAEYISAKYKYYELLEQGESEEEILLEIQDELNVKHQGVKKRVKILRKKEDN